MKPIKRMAMIFVTIFIIYAGTAGSAEPPAKYNLDNQMERVSEISKYNFMSWEKVDNQSFVLQTGPADYYLIVLSSPSDRLNFAETIEIPDTNAMVKPGYNNVIVHGIGSTDTYIINRIYRFKDQAQVKIIREQITGK